MSYTLAWVNEFSKEQNIRSNLANALYSIVFSCGLGVETIFIIE